MALTTIEALRKPKILDMSIFDWVTSLLGAWLVGVFFRVRGWMWPPFLLFWVFLGVFTHLAFGVNTMLGYYLGLNPKPQRTQS
jgi:hypothetical protein